MSTNDNTLSANAHDLTLAIAYGRKLILEGEERQPIIDTLVEDIALAELYDDDIRTLRQDVADLRLV